MNLTTEQQRAVNHNYGPMLILAGAGSGKTTTLVSRVIRLVKEKIAKPQEICLLTFTNKAAREMRGRIEARVQGQSNIWAGTFHSFGLEILRRNYKVAGLPKYFGVLDTADASQIVRELLRTLSVPNKNAFDDKRLLTYMSRAREGISYIAEDDYKLAVEWLMPKFEKKKAILGVVDFDDLIIKPYQLLRKNITVLETEQNRINQLMIDEFQDTNTAQMKLVDLLVAPHKNLTVVGDDDQSIYGWRGAQVSNILGFPKKFKDCITVRLEENYRSSKTIIDLANHVIQQNKKRHEKILKPMRDFKPQVPEIFAFETDNDEVDGVIREIYNFKNVDNFEFKDIAVFYRSNTQGAVLEGELKTKGIPYTISGGTSFLERKEVKDTLAYIRCAFRPNDVAYRRIFNTPARGLGDVTFENLHELSQRRNITFFEQARNWKSAGIPDRSGASIEKLNIALRNLKDELLNPNNQNVGDILVRFMRELGFREMIYNTTKEPLVAQKKWQWIEILGTILTKSIKNFPPKQKDYDEFLSYMELRDTEDENSSGVNLMTLHSSKGLEFPAVVIVGVEEDLIPHKTLGTDIDEERKLFYVGITRAQKRLILTHSKKRSVHNQLKPRIPSRFISQLDKNLVHFFPEGIRPVSGAERKQLLADLYKKLDG